MKEMRNLTGADIICECLIEQGVDTVFGLSLIHISCDIRKEDKER